MSLSNVIKQKLSYYIKVWRYRHYPYVSRYARLERGCKVYNPKNASIRLAFITRGWGKKYYDVNLAPQGWTEVTLTTAQLKNAGYIYIANVNQNEELTFLFTDFIAKK